MILVIDANVLISEMLRHKGRERIQDPRMTLFATEKVLGEANYEIPRRVSQIVGQARISQQTGDQLLQAAMQEIEAQITPCPLSLYAHLEAIARERIPRDPDDWETVALALTLEASIWTLDQDFLGCGIPTWTTETLIPHLNRIQREEDD